VGRFDRREGDLVALERIAVAPRVVIALARVAAHADDAVVEPPLECHGRGFAGRD